MSGLNPRIALGLAFAGLAVASSVALSRETPADSRETLRPASSFRYISNRDERSQAIFAEMGKVIQSPRCMNCHPRGDRPTQGDDRHLHRPAVTRGLDDHGAPGLECSVCHGDRNVEFATRDGSIPGHPLWHMAPLEMGWQGLSLGEICKQIKDRRRNGGKSLEDLVEHHGKDTLVGWAWRPGKGRKPAPGTQAMFGELTQAWIDSGASCPR